MNRFTDLRIDGFRRLRDVSIPMRPLGVMIGANGAGKTSVLDAVWLLARSAQGTLWGSLSELSGLTSVLSGNGAEALGLAIAMEISGHYPLEYAIELRPQGLGYVLNNETLSHKGPLTSRALPGDPTRLHIIASGGNVSYLNPDSNRMEQPNWEYDSLQTALSQVPKMFRISEDFRERLASATFYHLLNTDPRSPVRLPQTLQPAHLPGKNGEDLVSCLYYLRETEHDRFEAIEDALRAAFPRFDRLEFPPVAAGTLALAWREIGFSKPFYMHQLSEGTLRFLWLATLLQSSGLTALTLIDEPEVSLHPELLNLLAQLIREASERTQLIIATHSDRFIRFLEPKEVIVLDATEDGMTTLAWADQLDIEKWLSEYSLDELWQKGRIGARS